MLKTLLIAMMMTTLISGGTNNNIDFKETINELNTIATEATRDVSNMIRDLRIVNLYTTYTRYEDGGKIKDVSTRIYKDYSSEDNTSGWNAVFYIDVYDNERDCLITTYETYQHEYDKALVIMLQFEEGFKNQ